MPDDLKKQLNAYLKKAKNELATLDNFQEPEDVKASVKLIIEQCLSILDFSFNYYSRKKGKSWCNFPRQSRTVKDYEMKIRGCLSWPENQNNTQLEDFLRRCLPIIKKNNWDIRFLPSKIKHSETADINKRLKSQQYKYEGYGVSPDYDGEKLTIPGLGQFPKGGPKVRIRVFINRGQGNNTVINSLDYYPIFISGGYISLDDNGKKVRRNLKLWLKSCIKTCEGIIQII